MQGRTWSITSCGRPSCWLPAGKSLFCHTLVTQLIFLASSSTTPGVPVMSTLGRERDILRCSDRAAVAGSRSTVDLATCTIVRDMNFSRVVGTQ